MKKKISKRSGLPNVIESIIQNNKSSLDLLQYIWVQRRKDLVEISNTHDVRKSTKPIFSASLNIIQHIDKLSIDRAKEFITKAIEATNSLILKEIPYKMHGESISYCENELDEFGVLPSVAVPFLPPKTSRFEVTLVLDLDETLIHYAETESEAKLLLRPGVQQFLKDMSQIYEIVIFTAAMQDYADWVLDQLDSGKWISHRLYRQHLTIEKGVLIKDLSNLGRDLTKTIIVDNIAENFQKQPENGILIKSWFEDPNDDALIELGSLLKIIAKMKTAKMNIDKECHT